jgi:hypothetical protein
MKNEKTECEKQIEKPEKRIDQKRKLKNTIVAAMSKCIERESPVVLCKADCNLVSSAITIGFFHVYTRGDKNTKW